MADVDSGSLSQSLLDKVPLYESYYVSLYKALHRQPELSKQEHATAARIAEELRALCKDVSNLDHNIVTGIAGTGVVAVIRNGPGKTVLLRAELDALPLDEHTDLPYKSERSGAMHACGHDLHMTSLLYAAKLLVQSLHQWKGTLVVLFQPSEEDGSGAQLMVDDGLYDTARHHVPKPDIVLAGHTMPIPAGRVATRPGVVNAAAKSLSVTIFGKGGHGARPQTAIDPIVVASSVIMKLQTIVSRETAPQESVVVTVGSLHAGVVENIISDRAVMKINLRALSTEGLARAEESVRRIIEYECLSFRCPKPAIIEPIGGFPLLWNTPSLTTQICDVFASHFHDSFEVEAAPSLGSEDLCNLVLDGTECCFWNIGAINPETWAQLKADNRLHEVPGNHNSRFAPVILPTLTVAVKCVLLASLHAFGS